MLEDHSVRRGALGHAEAGGSFHVHHDRVKARDAAEALFAPKRQIAPPSNIAPAPDAEPTARKPRILSVVVKRAPVPSEPYKDARPLKKPAPSTQGSAPAVPKNPSQPSIPASDVGRIRTWLKYGMTLRQVALMYGVAAGEIERALER